MTATNTAQIIFQIEEVLSPSTLSTASSTTMPPTPQTQSRKTKFSKFAKIEKQKESFLEVATNFLKESSSHEENAYGRYIDQQLKEVTPNQRIIAEKLISDVIYYSKLQKLIEISCVQATPPYNNNHSQPITPNNPYVPQYPPQYHQNNWGYQYTVPASPTVVPGQTSLPIQNKQYSDRQQNDLANEHFDLQEFVVLNNKNTKNTLI